MPFRTTELKFEVVISLDHYALEELQWWLSSIDMVNGNLIRPPLLTLLIRTDASKAGWGEDCQGQHTNERGSDDKRTQHTDI